MGSSKRVDLVIGSRSWIVATTWRYVGLSGSLSITLTESETWLDAQTSRPSGLTARLTGSMPTSIRASTLRLLTPMTSIVSATVLTTKTSSPATTMGDACGLMKFGWPTALTAGGGGAAGSSATV